MPGMELVSVADLKEQEATLERALEVQLQYRTPESPFDERVLAAATAVKTAIELEKNDVKVVDLVQSVRKSWNDQRAGYLSSTVVWPKVAVASVLFTGQAIRIWSFRNGVVRFGRPGFRNRKRTIELPPGTDPTPSRTRTTAWAETFAPAIPPHVRPLVQPHHMMYWEVEEWKGPEKERPPRPPFDPVLLERIDGYLYKVVAEWDLTDLEAKAIIPG